MKNILRQSFFLAGSQAISRLIGLFYTIFLARSFAVADFGLYSVAMAFFSLFSSVADFGFNRYLIREIANGEQSRSKLLANVTLLRLAFTCLIFALFALILYILDRDHIRVTLILLGTLATIPQALSFSFDAIFVGLRKLQYCALAILVLSLSAASFGVVLVSAGFGPVGALVALIVGQLIYALFLFFLLLWKKEKIISTVDGQTIKHVIVNSLPYGILAVLGLLYFRVDMVLLSYLRGNFDTGIYGAAYKFLEATVLIPASIGAALYPVTVELLKKDKRQVFNLYLKISTLLLLLSLVILFLYVTILPQIIAAVLPAYQSSIGVIKVLSLTIPFLFMISPQGLILMSDQKYLKPLILISVFNLAFNFGLNLLLIPQFGYMGAAWTTVVSDIVGFSIFFFYIKAQFS